MASKHDGELPPDTTTHFIGALSPRELHVLVHDRVIKAAEAWVLLEIGSLVHPVHGCYIGNEKLAQRVGLSVRRLQEVLARLTDLGLIKTLKFDGHRRHIETRWVRVLGGEGGVDMRKTAGRTCGKPHGTDKEFRKGNKQTPASGVFAVGLGIARGKQPVDTTEADTATATKLLTAVRKYLGTSHPFVRGTHTTTWAAHIAKLRILDAVPEERITKTVAWYTTHIGDEYVPEAYTAASFRKKYPAIEAAMKRDAGATVEVTPDAEVVAGRLRMLGWPKGASGRVPQVAQASLDTYRAWVTGFRRFIDIVKEGGVDMPPKERKRLERFMAVVWDKIPQSRQFVQGWLTDVHNRVAHWDDWDGDLMKFVFNPNSKRWHATGRGWAEAFSGNPDYWDRMVDIMKREVPEAW